MAATAWAIYNEAKLAIGTAKIDFTDADGFKMALFTTGSNCPSVTLSSTDYLYAALTNQVSNANGYTTGGIALTSTWTKSGGTCTYTSSSNPAWTATDSGITCYYAVIYYDAGVTPAKPAVCYSSLDSGSAVTVTATNQLTVNVSAGIFTLT